MPKPKNSKQSSGNGHARNINQEKKKTIAGTIAGAIAGGIVGAATGAVLANDKTRHALGETLSTANEKLGDIRDAAQENIDKAGEKVNQLQGGQRKS